MYFCGILLKEMNKTPIAIRIIAQVYVIVLAVFLLFRGVQFSIHYKEVLADESIDSYDVLDAFIFGLRYDIVAASYLLLLPFILLLLFDYKQKQIYKKISFELVFYLFVASFMFAAADIPYYNKFYNRITLQAFEWFRDPITLFGLVFQEIKYWIIFIPLLFVILFFRKKLQVIFNQEYIPSTGFKHKLYYVISFIFIFVGIRGTIVGSPLKKSDAYQGKHVFLDALKLNPVLTLAKSSDIESISEDNALNLMDDKEAIVKIKDYFDCKQTGFKSPIARQLSYDSAKEKKKNVVLIIMESMAASKMKYFGNQENRTPFFDSIFNKGISFSNLYSNGIHTYAGVFGVNYAFPMLFDEHPMTLELSHVYNGLPHSLKQQGYHTSFFIPGSGEFDNMYAFLKENHYDTVYTKEDYPEEEIMSVWGPSDNYLLAFALEKINKQSKSNAPFLATILTITDHGPYRVPENYKPEAIDERVRATQFADWSLSQFMTHAAKQDWYEDTIFVFIADHGETMGITYKLPLTYNHIPLVYFYKGVKPRIMDNMASQLDVYPTLMGLLKLDYVNNSYGIDLLSEKRPYTLFNHDKEYGVIGQEFLLILDKEETFGLYKYRNKDKTNYSKTYPKVVAEMELYYKSHIQSYQYLLDNDLQYVE